MRTWICLLGTEFNPPHLLLHDEWFNDNHCAQTGPVGVSYWRFGEHPFFLLSSFLSSSFNKYLSIYLLGCIGSHGLSCPMAYGILVPPLGMEPTSPALEGRFLTTGAPGSPRSCSLLEIIVAELLAIMSPALWRRLPERVEPRSREKQREKTEEEVKEIGSMSSTCGRRSNWILCVCVCACSVVSNSLWLQFWQHPKSTW